MMLALKRKTRKELLASKVSNLVSDTNENLLRVNLSKFFTDLEAEIQKALLEYWNDTMLLQGQVNLILAPIHEKQREYYELIMRHKLQEFHRAEQQGRRLVKRAENIALKSAKPVRFDHNRNNLFGTLQYTEDKLRNNTFTASQNTLNRVDSNINQILTDGYREGAGINAVSRQITERFDQLRTWEANRIARTEIHTAQNMGIMNSYDSLGVEYTQWIAANDDRTRESHAEIDGEIIPIGETYSNGLSFPGDTSGDIEEWINCRCSNAPFVLPAGMMAPSFSPFREEDLIPIETQNSLDNIEQQPVEPTIDAPYQLNNRENSFSDVKITQEQFEKVIAHQSKREKAKLEFGNSIDNETGNLIHAKDIRGKKNRVHVPTSNRPYSVIHNHTNDGGFSGGDAYSHILGAKQQVCYATTPKGVWIMRDTNQGTFSKKEGFISENTATEIKYKMEGKYREIVKDVKSKYQPKYDNAKTREEKNKIGQKVNNEVFTQYNDWLLDEFAVGKRRDWLIEIEFIPKEKLKDVKF